MDAVEYVKALRRLCRSKIKCSECQLLNKEEHCCMADIGECAEKTVQIVEQWAKDHPVRTRQSEFLRMFPKAEMKDDYLWMCPKYINYDYNPEENCHEISCSDCKRKFWLTEVTDND